jgi:hypothetical protein
VRIVPPVLGVVFAVVLPVPWLAIPAFFLMRGVDGVSRTLEQQSYDQCEQSERGEGPSLHDHSPTTGSSGGESWIFPSTGLTTAPG